MHFELDFFLPYAGRLGPFYSNAKPTDVLAVVITGDWSGSLFVFRQLDEKFSEK